MTLRPELELIDQLDGGPLPLHVVDQLFGGDREHARQVLWIYISKRVLQLLRGEAHVIPEWEARQVLYGDDAWKRHEPDEHTVRADLTHYGAGLWHSGEWESM